MKPPIPLPEQLGEPDSSIPNLPGRTRETLSLDLAHADTEEGAARLREFCRKRKLEGGAALSEMFKKRRTGQ